MLTLMLLRCICPLPVARTRVSTCSRGRVNSTAAAGVQGLAEQHEDIRVVVKSFAEIEALLDRGAIESGHTLIGLYSLLRHRDVLSRAWPQ
jgi:ADP-ribose pyrophosphatase